MADEEHRSASGPIAGLASALITQAQLAEALGVSQRKLERDRQQGTGIPFIKVGRRVLYRCEDIEAYLEAHRFTSTAESKLSGGRS